MTELKIVMLLTNKYLIQNMKKIFLGLFLISCEIGHLNESEFEVWEIEAIPDEEWGSTVYTPETEESFQFMVFDIERGYEELRDIKVPKGVNSHILSRLIFPIERYCYADSKKELNTAMNQKQTEKDITNSNQINREGLAERVNEREKRYRWIHFKSQPFTPDKSELYFILFRVYDKSGQVISEKRIYDDYHRYSEVFFPYSVNIHFIKAFLMENSTGREIKKIGETYIFSLKKIKEFSNKYTANCHVIEKS